MSSISSDEKQILALVLRLLDTKAKLAIETNASKLPRDHVFTRMRFRFLNKEVQDPSLRSKAAVELAMAHLDEFGAGACAPILKEFERHCQNASYRDRVCKAYELARAQLEQPEAYVFRRIDADLFVRVFQPAKSISKPRPALVFLFGGGWYLGKPEQFFGACKYFAKRGFVAITVDYRTKGRHNTPPAEGLKDVKSALRYIRMKAESLEVDPRQISLCGWSAGGHLAIAASIFENLNHENDDLSITGSPDSVIMLAPGIDVSTQEWYAYVNRGSSIPPRALSVRHHLRKNLPPTLTLYGELDKVVDRGEIDRFHQSMRNKGNHSEVSPSSAVLGA